jgi:hypothetical protein
VHCRCVFAVYFYYDQCNESKQLVRTDSQLRVEDHDTSSGTSYSLYRKEQLVKFFAHAVWSNYEVAVQSSVSRVIGRDGVPGNGCKSAHTIPAAQNGPESHATRVLPQQLEGVTLFKKDDWSERAIAFSKKDDWSERAMTFREVVLWHTRSPTTCHSEPHQIRRSSDPNPRPGGVDS